MIWAEQQSPKAEGRIMPSALLHRFAARIIGTVLRLRAPAERYAQDDTREALRSGWHKGSATLRMTQGKRYAQDDTMESKSLMLLLWPDRPDVRAADTLVK